MPSAIANTCLDVNQAFHRYASLGMTRRLKARATVNLIQYPKHGFRVALLLDYSTAAWDPRLAPAQAIAAEYLFDGLTERQYHTTIRAAKAQCGATTDKQVSAAQMEALNRLIQSPSAVCIFRDDAVLTVLAQPLPDSQVQVPAEAIQLMLTAALYDGQQTLAGSVGPVTAEAVAERVRSTLGVGMTCFTEERIAQEQESGEHMNWNLIRGRAA
ncbi:hypothetical protein [Pseudomonas baetica]|uniref:hypothetical protein n=1 Tax=Pseudomonas baetica TaxID=674054 RepID=UPI002406D29B|nr:hypothetical protein [Pseudomonas baetica]MDF9779009.1 hypothetical protein [Pseudomonas baetica]